MNKRKIILNLCTSLDGFIEGPNGEYDWCFTDQDYCMTEFLGSIDAIFYGRKSYELMLKDSIQHFAHIKSYVFSKSKTFEGVTMIDSDIEKAVKEIQNQPGKNIWLFGGASLTTTFINLGLLDELIISVHPLLLGNGKPLFIDIERRKNLKLTDTKTFSTGLVQLYYELEK